jgi:hypothetical protein
MGSQLRRSWIWSRSRTVRTLRAIRRAFRPIPWSIRAAVPLLVLVAGTLWAFRAVGLLDVTNKDTTGSHFTAVLALVGVLTTAAVAFLGHAVNRQGETRQAVDSAIRAIELFVRPDGSPAEPSMAGAGLLALASLGQLELAISLLSDLWPARRVPREAATDLIDRALSSHDPVIQINAAYVLHTNSDRLWKPLPSARTSNADSTSPGEQAGSSSEVPEDCDWTYVYPDLLFLRWDDSLSLQAKERLSEAWVYLWTTAPITAQPEAVATYLTNLAIGLEMIWRTETTPAVRNSVGHFLESILKVPGITLPIEGWVGDRRRQVTSDLTNEIERWRGRRKSHARKFGHTMELSDSVSRFATELVAQQRRTAGS